MKTAYQVVAEEEIWNLDGPIVKNIRDYIPQTGSREDYEMAIRSVDLEPKSDKDVCDYGMHYGEFYKRGTEKQYVHQAISAPRRKQLEKEKSERMQVLIAEQEKHWEYVTCPKCHQETPKSRMMMGNLSSLCPDCFADQDD